MRIPVLTLCFGLLAVTAISLVVRDALFVSALSLIALAVIGWFGVYFAFRSSATANRSRAVIVSGLGFVALLGLTNAPIRIAFISMESRFEATSEGILSGNPPHFPTWIGPFRIIGGGIRYSDKTPYRVPYLMTGGQDYEIMGFVRDPEGRQFNIWTITSLTKDWAYVEED